MASDNRKRLTKMTLEMRAPAGGRVEVRDADSPLIFRVSAADNRSFCVRVRVGGKGQPQCFTYEKLTVIDNLGDARAWARQTVEACRMGQDPRETEKAAEVAAALAAKLAETRQCKNVVADYSRHFYLL